MLYTTARLGLDHRVCFNGWRKFHRYFGDVKKLGKDTPIPLTEILTAVGLEDATMTLHFCMDGDAGVSFSKRLAVEYVKHINSDRKLNRYLRSGYIKIEDLYPDDPNPAWTCVKACYRELNTKDRTWMENKFIELLNK